MEFDPQHFFENDLLTASALKAEDFDELYLAASDPEVWANHPNKNRYQLSEFTNFFKGAMESGGAYAVRDKASGRVIGSTRFYDLNKNEKSVLIGYTFYAKEFWGKNYNLSLKRMMIEYAFFFLDKIIFHIGAVNVPSQNSIVKLGAKKVAELEVAYFGEAPKLNYVYELNKSELLRRE